MIPSSPKTNQKPAIREYLPSDAVAAPLPLPTGTLKDSNDLPSGLDGLTRQRDTNPSKEVENMFISFGASMTALATSLIASVSPPGATSHEPDRAGRTVTSTGGDDQMPLEDTGSSIRDDPGLTDEPAVLPPASVSQAFESLGHVDSHQATKSADETSTFDHIIAKSMRRRSKRIVRKAINRVKARSEGKPRGDSPHGSSQTLQLNSISEASEEDAVGFTEASIDNMAGQAVNKVNVRQENTIVEPRVDVASRKRDELNAAPLDSSLSREYRDGTQNALESLNEVVPFNGKAPRVGGSKKRASTNKVQSRTHIDSTLTMSASKLYKTFIASRDDEGDSPLSNRGVSKVYIQSMLRGISQSRASGARQQRILSRSRFYGKAVG
ncbi:hypothetical protein Pmar_PMAR017370 [Perkinsus marinus ATCC 50983]|uniref:Uncharacterized protein n=1 Tax=Perkinsus marinus (strain ATCC 50983 / TXsc) TaxID=423536 RepID=C5LHE6_PERM5|nr:hypothetical protein Pmar_PMAR017370 [Perkinsus marinus ATCC 50983]EER03955.1 hypothetical protein Pmar_PMAR017370 [Perkinsus marinus ATCC 50983]|eukprot:XP_002772139.1 hypothetical protein Pmar_PMAR017370 [Perkinsus marinus ATCC 50983]